MSSINAMKFDDYSGIMLCDEQRTWNQEGMKFYVSDKIKPCIPEAIIRDTGLVAAFGNTGTNTIGAEIKFSVLKKLNDDYSKFRDRMAGTPCHFKTMEELSETVFNVITDIKRKHIDEQLKSSYGFNSVDYLKGYYEDNGKKIDLKDKDVISQAHKLITWKERSEEVKPVFFNSGVLAGYDNKEGFRIFHFSLTQFFREPVQFLYLTEGLGYDVVNLHLSDYISHKSIPERRGNIDPVEGTMELLSAVNKASKKNFGVGGYYSIILFNGKEKNYIKRIKEINDHRAKLAWEIMEGRANDLISQDVAYTLIKDLLFEDRNFEEINKDFVENSTDPQELRKVLRGYKR